MKKFEKMIYKDSEYMARCERYTEFCKIKVDVTKELIRIFKIHEICNWLNNLLRRIKI